MFLILATCTLIVSLTCINSARGTGLSNLEDGTTTSSMGAGMAGNCNTLGLSCVKPLDWDSDLDLPAIYEDESAVDELPFLPTSLLQTDFQLDKRTTKHSGNDVLREKTDPVDSQKEARAVGSTEKPEVLHPWSFARHHRHATIASYLFGAPPALQNGVLESGSLMGIKGKDKAVLLLLEMVPFAGPLGFDRFYLGCYRSGMAKLIFCVGTCGMGGVVWYLLDALVVVINGLNRSDSIDALGMQATFQADGIEFARMLSVISLAFIVTATLLGALGHRLWRLGFMAKTGEVPERTDRPEIPA